MSTVSDVIKKNKQVKQILENLNKNKYLARKLDFGKS